MDVGVGLRCLDSLFDGKEPHVSEPGTAFNLSGEPDIHPQKADGGVHT